MSGDEIFAGSFHGWLIDTQATLRRDVDADVPCGTCTSCCRSSQFILLEPNDPARDHLDPALLAPAIGLPDGFDVLGYDEHGHCPALVDDRCSIYEHRPRTCRAYDCRVFPATGIWPETGTKVAIVQRASRWSFAFDDDGTRDHAAATRAGEALVAHSEALFGERPPERTQLAAMAIIVCDLFTDGATPTIGELRTRLQG